MTSNRQADEQLKGLLERARHYNEGTSRKLQTLSLMTLLWPLLPNLPPEPPRAAMKLLKENSLEQCDVCGCPATPLHKGNVVNRHSGLPGTRESLSPSTRESLSPGTKGPLFPDTRGPLAGAGVESPLAKMMADIEKKMDATLSSIETTTQRTDKLNKEAKELELAGQSNMTDAELIATLKSLMSEKSSREERVKVLEDKEHQLKESLMTAIDWAKKVDTKK